MNSCCIIVFRCHEKETKGKRRHISHTHVKMWKAMRKYDGHIIIWHCICDFISFVFVWFYNFVSIMIVHVEVVPVPLLYFVFVIVLTCMYFVFIGTFLRRQAPICLGWDSIKGSLSVRHQTSSRFQLDVTYLFCFGILHVYD